MFFSRRLRIDDWVHHLPRQLALSLSLMAAVPYLAVADEQPAFSLAKQYVAGTKLSEYWVSEKYDGVRAYWNGKAFISRNGNTFYAPAWFTDDFPNIPLDGELWVGRKQFAKTMSIVSRYQPHQEWNKIKYMVFDMPTAGGDFDSRLQKMRQLFADRSYEFLVLVKQEKILDEQTLLKKLDDLSAIGGEGLMLRRAKSLHEDGRSSDLLKLKKFSDAEAIVLQHNAGKGKYQGMMGSILVRSTDGQVFKIGSGFNDQERRQPPPVGSTITFKHQGHYETGTPRFPVFLRPYKSTP